MNLKLHLTAVFLFLVTIAMASTTVPAVISSSQVWNASGSPYLISSNVIIDAGVSLDIKPGVRVVSDGNYRITVNGRLTAIGTYDSVISFQSLTIYFSDTSADYNPSLNTGSQFKNCSFKTFSKSSGQCIILDRTDMKIDYCLFDSISYPIYGNNSDSVKLWVSNSIFNSNGFGFLITGLRVNTYLSFTNCAVMSIGYITLAENSVISNCYFYGPRYYPSINVSSTSKKALISCNYFKNGKDTYAPAIDLSSVSSYGCNIQVQNNEFDSMAVFFKMSCFYYATDTININNNDFLNYTTKAVYYNGCFSGTGTWHWVDFTGNYWNTTDTTLIKNAIFDYRNDAKVPFLVDFSSFKSNRVSYCWPPSPADAPKKQNTSGMHLSPSGSPVLFSPNPARNSITIAAGNSIISEVILYDLSGRVILQKSFSTERVTIDLSSLPPGIYLAEMHYMNGETSRSKFMHIE